MISTGIRELKNNLSHYLRRVRAGHRVVVTDRGEVIAELVPAAAADGRGASRYAMRGAQGGLRPALEPGDLTADFPPPG